MQAGGQQQPDGACAPQHRPRLSDEYDCRENERSSDRTENLQATQSGGLSQHVVDWFGFD
jgi:hypothetical protein